MAARRVRVLKLRPAAQGDLQTLWLTIAGVWSVEQAERDVRRLYDAFQRLIDRPDIGAIRPELGGAIRVQPAGAHIILYQIADDHIDIIRIRAADEDWIRTTDTVDAATEDKS